MRVAGIILVAVMAVGAGPATKPSAVETIRAEVAKIESDVNDAKDAALLAVRDKDQKLKAALAAEKNTSSQLARAKNRQEKEAAKKRHDTAMLRLEDESARIYNASPAYRDASARLNKAKADLNEAIERDPIEKAIRKQNLAIGMTLDQANRAMGGQGKLIAETELHQRYEWYRQIERTGTFESGKTYKEYVHSERPTYATFRKGKLVDYQDL